MKSCLGRCRCCYFCCAKRHCQTLLLTLSLLLAVASLHRSHRLLAQDDVRHHYYNHQQKQQREFVTAFVLPKPSDAERHQRRRRHLAQLRAQKELLHKYGVHYTFEKRLDFTKLLLSPNETEDSSSSPPWAVFYNIYVPPQDLAIGALQIIQEQLGQIGRSYAALKYLPENKTLRVFYNSIGAPIDPVWMQQVCAEQQGLKCHHLHHYDTAFEEVTLQRAWEYCHDFPSHKAIYMHSKGSFNSRGGNNKHWRRHMTYAISHQDCVEPPTEGLMRDCNLCGLVLNPQPWIHFSGNFFTADCGYVNKLLPMDVYRRKMDQLAVKTRRHANASRFLFHTFPDNDAYLGLERYASEHWPGSHPDVIPCDLSVPRKINFWKTTRAELPVRSSLLTVPSSSNETKDTWTSPIGDIEDLLLFSLAPRPSDTHGDELFPRRFDAMPGIRLREYYLMAGNLFKWLYLYGHAPVNSSWVWKYYPDGGTWRHAYHHYVRERTIDADKRKKVDNEEDVDDEIVYGDDSSQGGADAVLEAVVERYAARERSKLPGVWKFMTQPKSLN